MLLRILKPYQMFSPGAEVNFPNPVADLLVKRGLAEVVKSVKAAKQAKPKS